MADEVIQLAAKVARLGMRVKYDAGVLVVDRVENECTAHDEDCEIERMVVAQLGEHIREVFPLAIGRARGERGKFYASQQVFMPDARVTGKVVDCSEDGVISLAYKMHENQRRDSVLSVPADGLALIVAIDEPRGAKASYGWLSDDRIRRFLERAESASIRFEDDCGFLVAKWYAVDEEKLKMGREVIQSLTPSLARDIARIMRARERGVGAQQLVGARVYVGELNAFGVIADASADGRLVVRYTDRGLGSEITSHCDGERVLVLRGDVALPRPGETAPTADPKSEGLLASWFRRAFRLGS